MKNKLQKFSEDTKNFPKNFASVKARNEMGKKVWRFFLRDQNIPPPKDTYLLRVPTECTYSSENLSQSYTTPLLHHSFLKEIIAWGKSYEMF